MTSGIVRLFALIIGIDDYANGNKLGGAVADAKAIKEYLEEALQVPRDHISTLYNAEATRNAIIAAFKGLQSNERINHGDAIMIFYSGHGSKLPAPPAWRLESKIQIQCLLPQDYEAVTNEPVSHRAPIPDRTIGALIDDIAKLKGDNITVIFDCCFSGSGTRDGYVARGVDLDMNIPDTLDNDIWGTRDGTISNGFVYHGLRSHVLLAACSERELAYEHKGRGQFTGALLEKLKSSGVNDLTYAELLKQIQLERQHPQCEGVNQHRVLFNGRVPDNREIYYPVRVSKGNKYVIGAGFAHGVAHGVEFTLYDEQKLAMSVVMVDERSLIKSFETTVPAAAELTTVSFAKFTGIGKLPLYVDPRGNLSSALEALPCVDGRDTTGPKFRLVRAEEAKLEIAMEHDQVVFKVLDERLRRFGLTKLPRKTTLNSIVRILDSAAHYYWFLGLSKGDDRISISAKHKVAVEFYRLRVDFDDFGEPLLFPEEPGLCHKDPNTDDLDVIDFVIDPNALYGIKMTNKTPWDLYLNAFLFNNSSLSIVPYYTQSSAGEPEAPLKQGETFTIGYGPGGTAPFSYSLEGGQDVDVGYLKIFFATRPIDLSDIVQPSPFVSVEARGGADDNDALTSRGGGWGVVKAVSWLSFSRKPAHACFTLDIPVVQRRRGTA